MNKFDDTELFKKKKGDKIFYKKRNEYSFNNKVLAERELTVTRVNDEYIYAHSDEKRYNKYKFHKSVKAEIVDYGSHGYCYSSKEYCEAEEEAIRQIKCMEDEFSRMHTDSDMRLVNAMYELMNNWEG